MNRTTVSKLQIHLPISWWIKFKTKRLFAKIVCRIPFLEKLCSGIGNRILAISSLSKEEKRQNKIITSLLSGESESVQWGYADEAREATTALKYHLQLRDPNFSNAVSESPALYKSQIETLSALLQGDPSINGIFNFGVSFGHVDSEVSKLFPKKQFIGLDRSEIVKTYNEAFLISPNLKFIAGDVFEALSKEDLKDFVLFTSRTLTFLPPEFVLKVYSQAKKAGIKYIVGFEQMGVSHQTGAPYAFRDYKSVLFRGGMMMHNYQWMLGQCGYRLNETEFIKTNHPHKDFRILKFVAKIK